MVRTTIIRTLTVLLVFFCCAAEAAYIEQFDIDDGNWFSSTIKSNGQLRYYKTNHFTEGGNLDGYISAKVDNDSSRLYAFEPYGTTAFTPLSGGVLTVDTKITGTVTGPGKKPTVRFYVGTNTGGSDYFVSNDLFSWDINSDADWSTHSIRLATENFVLWPNQAAGSKTFEQVLDTVEDIGLVFTDEIEYFNKNSFLGFKSKRGATIEIDNFGTVGYDTIPDAATIILLTMGTVPMFRRRFRRSCQALKT